MSPEQAKADWLARVGYDGQSRMVLMPETFDAQPNWCNHNALWQLRCEYKEGAGL